MEIGRDDQVQQNPPDVKSASVGILSRKTSAADFRFGVNPEFVSCPDGIRNGRPDSTESAG